MPRSVTQTLGSSFQPQHTDFQIGPTGGDNGYSAITGHVGWGIAWYINGLLIPEIYVVRGKTYTFVVEGGDDKEFPAGYHPFYITDDPEGGYEFKSERERRRSRVRTRQTAANIVKTNQFYDFPTSGLRWSGADQVRRRSALGYWETLRVERGREAASKPLQLIRCLSEVSQSLLSRRWVSLRVQGTRTGSLWG